MNSNRATPNHRATADSELDNFIDQKSKIYKSYSMNTSKCHNKNNKGDSIDYNNITLNTSKNNIKRETIDYNTMTMDKSKLNSSKLNDSNISINNISSNTIRSSSTQKPTHQFKNKIKNKIEDFV